MRGRVHARRTLKGLVADLRIKTLDERWCFMGGMDPNMFAADQTLTLNANNALVKYLFEHKDSEHSGMFAEQLYDLAMLSNQPLSAEAMTKFVKRSNDIMLLLTK